MELSRQQSFIEETTLDFTKAIPAMDFVDLRDFLDEIDWIVSNTDFSNESTQEILRKFNTSSNVDIAVVDNDEFIEKCMEDPDKYDEKSYLIDSASIMLSNFSGHYIANDSMQWTYSKADDLQFIFKDSLGDDCVLKVTKKGKEVNILTSSLDGSGDELDISSGKKYVRVITDGKDTVYHHGFKVKCSSLYIPEQVIVSLKRDKKKEILATVNTSLSNLKKGDIDINKNNLSLSTFIETGNGIQLNLGVEYRAGRFAAASLLLKKNVQNLLMVDFSTKMSKIPLNINVYDPDYKSAIDSIKAKNVYLNVNLMDKLRLTGSIGDVKEITELMDSAEKVYPLEVKFNNLVDRANELINVGLYYEGSSKRQASLVIDSECNTEFNGKYYTETWSYAPVIVLADGSRTSILGEFIDSDLYTELSKCFSLFFGRYSFLFKGATKEELENIDLKTK